MAKLCVSSEEPVAGKSPVVDMEVELDRPQQMVHRPHRRRYRTGRAMSLQQVP